MEDCGPFLHPMENISYNTEEPRIPLPLLLYQEYLLLFIIHKISFLEEAIRGGGNFTVATTVLT